MNLHLNPSFAMLTLMSKIPDGNNFRIDGKSPLKLSGFPNKIDPLYKDKKDYSKQLGRLTEEIDELQQMMSANDHDSLLLVFQAMDAAGKDGTIRNVLSGVNPHGVNVHSFKRPSEEEIDHDFLWRSMACLPRRGQVSVFNRSYYEEVLVVKVHSEIFTKYQRVPKEHHENVWEGRYASIKEHEAHLTRNGTRVVKFFLNVSKVEQLDRFVSRIDESDKNWKFNESDVEERKFWDQYQVAYEEAINATATVEAPWFVIPADDKKTMRLLVAGVIRDEMKALGLSYPEVSETRGAELKAMRETLVGGNPA
ncbi:MAG: polyphosphate kinase 2 family protein [Akkermansiaceae bacterium]|jgi:PPK2 family polyphosphate:nucleotide phosphotransferase